MEEQKSSFRYLVLVLIFLNMLFIMIAVNCIPPLFTEIMEDIPLTKAKMGTIMGVVTLASLFFAPMGGAIADRFGCRWALGGACLIIVIAGGLRAFAVSPFQFIGLMFIFGIGAALFSPAVPKALGMWFSSRELAMANGIVFTSMGIGGAIAMATATSLMSPNFGGWSGTMLVLGGISLFMAIVWMIFYRDREVRATADKKKKYVLDNFKKVFKVKDIWLIAMFYGLNMLSLYTLISFLPVLFEERGLSRPGQLVSVLMITSVVFNIVGATISDKTGKRKAFIIGPVIVFGIAVLTFGTLTGVPLIIALLIAGACMGTIGPVLMTIPVELKKIGPALTATAVGLIFMVGNTGGFLGPVLIGKLMDVTGSQMAAFIFMGTILILSAGCIIPLTETGRKKKQGEEASIASH